MIMSGMDTTTKDDDQAVLPGFRFHPTDEELVSFYLQRKIEKQLTSLEFIKQIDIYKHDPWELAKNNNSVTYNEWYFFCRRGRKYRNSIRPNRVTGSGFWKATGIDKPIYPFEGEGHGHGCIGLKKSLVYYSGSAGKGTKTDWMMHEFRLPADLKNANIPKPQTADQEVERKKQFQIYEIWTLCRIFKRNNVSSRIVSLGSRDSSTKRNPTNARPKTINVDSENREAYISFGAPEDAHIEKKPVHAHKVEERNRLHVGPELAEPCSSVLGGEAGNWDEIVSAMEYAFDPNHLYRKPCMQL